MDFIIVLSILFIFILPFLLREKPIFATVFNIVILIMNIFILFKGSDNYYLILLIVVPWILGNFFKKNIEELDAM